jgi:hypothetical protein
MRSADLSTVESEEKLAHGGPDCQLSTSISTLELYSKIRVDIFSFTNMIIFFVEHLNNSILTFIPGNKTVLSANRNLLMNTRTTALLDANCRHTGLVRT